MSTKSDNWGGSREGAGRKRLETPNKRYGFVSTPESRAILDSLDGKLSQFINEAIVAYAKTRR